MPSGQKPEHWLGLVVRDIQFWIPVVVLLGGLLVLRWIGASQP